MERVNAELAKQITKVIAEDIKDPRLKDAIVGVTKVYTTPDLKYAKVYLSIYAKKQRRRARSLLHHLQIALFHPQYAERRRANQTFA